VRRRASAPRSPERWRRVATPSASWPAGRTASTGCSLTAEPPHRSRKRWVADLEDLDRSEQVALEAWDVLGGLDVLVNNAAIPQVCHVTKLTRAEIERQMRVNYLSPVCMTMALLPHAGAGEWHDRERG
jgi:NAD(P)-dependent dehydrogenase (short-subunit alcohol dehydrogenase family)